MLGIGFLLGILLLVVPRFQARRRRAAHARTGPPSRRRYPAPGAAPVGAPARSEPALSPVIGSDRRRNREERVALSCAV